MMLPQLRFHSAPADNITETKAAVLLIHSTLAADFKAANSSAETLAKLLRRVSGILFVEIDTMSKRVTVVHAAAVRSISVVEAAATIGAHATVVDTGSSSRVESSKERPIDSVLKSQDASTVIISFYVTAALLCALVPTTSSYMLWMLLAMSIALWMIPVGRLPRRGRYRRPPSTP